MCASYFSLSRSFHLQRGEDDVPRVAQDTAMTVRDAQDRAHALNILRRQLKQIILEVRENTTQWPSTEEQPGLFAVSETLRLSLKVNFGPQITCCTFFLWDYGR